MNRIPSARPIAWLALAVFVVACSGQATASPPAAPTATAASIVGTWKCGPPEASGQDIVEIRADGTVTITQPDVAPDVTPGGSIPWEVEGNRGAFITPEGRDEFTIEADRIVFDDGFVCTRAT